MLIGKAVIANICREIERADPMNYKFKQFFGKWKLLMTKRYLMKI